MASLKAAATSAAEEQLSSNKRRRLEENPGTTASLLDCLNDDILLHILKFLPADDLNEFAICSKRCQGARAHSDLDQTRTGTIIFGTGTEQTIPNLIDRMANERWDEVFQGNRTHLRIKGVENYGIMRSGDDREISSVEEEIGQHIRARGIQLRGVISLDLSHRPAMEESLPLNGRVLYALKLLLPNLSEIDLSYRDADMDAVRTLMNQHPRLTRIAWKSASDCWNFGMLGHTFRECESLRELYIQGVYFGHVGYVDCFSKEQTDESYDPWLLMYCSARLERLDIKGATHWCPSRTDRKKPIPDEIIMKFVRHAPALRWLRSDLSAGNVALLKQERPDVTFECK